MELEDLIEEIDIVDFISQYVDLEERNGEFWGLSPFKSENTPSFSVRKETKRFYDFSSGIGGNVFTFVRYYHKCNSAQAVDILRKYVGIDDKSCIKKRKLSATMVFKRYRNKQTTKKSSLVSIFPDNCMEKYEFRPEKMKIWEDEGISRDSLIKFQVFYDAFSDRLVYPIKNTDGKIINIGGRTLDPDFKAKKLRKYTYFSSWGELDVVYGLYENMESVLERKEIIIFEGCKSVLIADSWGIHNTGALLTSHLNPNQMKIFAKLGVKVVFALDNDVDIKKDHNIEKLSRYVQIEYLHDDEKILDDKDSPVDKGFQVFQKLYEHKIPYKGASRSV